MISSVISDIKPIIYILHFYFMNGIFLRRTGILLTIRHDREWFEQSSSLGKSSVVCAREKSQIALWHSSASVSR